MVGIIGAMDVEVNEIKKRIDGAQVKTAAGIEFVCGKINGVEVCTAQCSPGKVNAALCTQLMIDLFSPACVINTGVGCSLSESVVIKDVVIADCVYQYDMDTTACGDPLGFICGLDTVKIEADKTVSNALAQAGKDCGETIHRGAVATGDTFIASTEMKRRIADNFGALCGEMEGGSVGHVCYANGVPFAVLRSISDGGNEESKLDYPAFKIAAARISIDILLNALGDISNAFA